ncbi:MAG: Asp-tRNA(Asn)/Glu-tRNA(Gln) amidotransferase subunit GatA [Candidatus Aenigmarchaeota archaeon]|nr:Asp-tRNA(Asn)/Glu-tRNA(Gln) amidotransferase subunit GatA [Candidatus Aenigmarchaeota archaeon]
MNYKMSVREFIENSKSGGIDYRDFIQRFFEQLKKINKKYDYLIAIAEPEIENPDENLFGLPVSVKDNICTKGLPSTAGSKILENYVPIFDATAVDRIKKQNGAIVGKTTMDEFGFGTFSTNCAYGIPKNPYDRRRSCGGSSGGAAGLTAATDFPHAALAESTGGSISCPASFCGVVGLTPTYGLVSRYGLIDYANSLDKIGCIGKTVWDVAFLLSIIAGHDDMDSTSLNEKPTDYTKNMEKKPKKIEIGIPKEYFKNIDERVEKVVWHAIKKIEKHGFEYEMISLPHTKHALSSYYIIACAEASTNLAKFCGLRYGLHEKLEGNFNEYFSDVRSHGFGMEAKRRIMLGTFARMAGYRNKYYLKALKVRTLIINEFKRAFKKFDCLMAPTMPITAPKFSEIKKLSPIENYRLDVLTVPANLAGIPHLSIPCGFVNGLPVGLHILGDYLREEKILRIGNEVEKILKVRKT